MEQSPTRLRLVEAARALFWEKGYGATGIAEILSRAGANAGSFYYFFKSKEALLEAVLQSYLMTLDSVVIQPVYATIRDPFERIFGILDVYRRNLIATRFAYSCPIGRLAFELDTGRERTRHLIDANFEHWRVAIAAALEAADLEMVESRSLAQFVLAVMEGAVMQARAQGTIDPFDGSIEHLRHYLNKLRRKPSARRKKVA